MLLKLPSYFTGFSSRKDGSASLRFTTNELTAEDFSLFKEALNDFGWLIFTSEKSVAVPKGAPTDSKKTPSQRLYNTLFVYWTQLGSKGDFQVFYRQSMEKLIDRVKAKLDD